MRRSLLLTLVLVLLACPPAAVAHGGASENYESVVTRVKPAVDGLELTILDRDDRLRLRNRTGSEVIVEGYNGEPYLRFREDGTVEQNRRAPTTYLNEDRYAKVDVPASANPKAAPEWRPVSRAGTYEWHDHRVHWMSTDTPPQVKDEGKRTKVIDWKVPLTVGGRRATVLGTLTWVPSSGIGTVLAVVSLVGAVVLFLGLGFLVLKARGQVREERKESAEVW